MKKVNKKIWLALLALLVIGILIWLFTGKKEKHTVTFETEKVVTTNIQNSITATGTIEPVTSVTVGTQVSGIVAHLYVDYNSVVRKGQVIAELDKTNLISELNTAKANLNSVQSSLNYQSANFNRYKTLYEKGLVSADDFENARLAYQQANQQVAQARETVKRAQTNLAMPPSPLPSTVSCSLSRSRKDRPSPPHSPRLSSSPSHKTSPTCRSSPTSTRPTSVV